MSRDCDDKFSPGQLCPRIPDVYNGKSVFITGAAGYLGVVLLELLLRCCPGIEKIYILLREKKGVQPECRKDVIFKKKLMRKLLEKLPDAVDKVIVVPGDITRPNLGMSQQNYEKVVDNVSIVFHLAACISFLKPLRFMLTQNVLGTWNVINLSRKLKNLDSFIYTSTAYSNSNRINIEEQIYRLPFPVQRFLDELKTGSDDDLENLVSQCYPRWLNYYTFSKCLAENLFLEYSDLPVAIVRPSIVVNCWKGILPGYVEEGSGLVDITIAVGRGFARVVNLSPQCRMEIIPADIVANAHVVSSWNVITDRRSSPLVINVVCDSINVILEDFVGTLFKMSKMYPMPKSFQKPTTIKLLDNNTMYYIVSLFEHYIPAFIIDRILEMTGRKPKLVRLYRFFDKAVKAVKPFITTNFQWRTETWKGLERELHPEDKKNFYMDFEGFDAASMANSIPHGAPFYEWDIDKKPIAERKRITTSRYMFTTLIKASVLGFACLILSIMFSQIKQFHSHGYILL